MQTGKDYRASDLINFKQLKKKKKDKRGKETESITRQILEKMPSFQEKIMHCSRYNSGR